LKTNINLVIIFLPVYNYFESMIKNRPESESMQDNDSEDEVYGLVERIKQISGIGIKPIPPAINNR